MKGEALADTSRQPVTPSPLIVEVAPPWCVVTLFFVPSRFDEETLVAEGVPRGRIWTISEVAQLRAAGLTPEEVVKVAGTRVLFDGTLAGIGAAPEIAVLKLCHTPRGALAPAAPAQFRLSL